MRVRRGDRPVEVVDRGLTVRTSRSQRHRPSDSPPGHTRTISTRTDHAVESLRLDKPKLTMTEPGLAPCTCGVHAGALDWQHQRRSLTDCDWTV
jgi:hypothetical protein